MKASFRLTLAFGLVVSFAIGAMGADWPGFRGSRGGVADDGDLPVKWDDGNFLWKTKLPGAGASSPITYGDKIFVTCYSGYGTKLAAGMGGGKGGKGGGGAGSGDMKALRYHLLCIDRAKGEVVWKKDIEPKLPEANFGSFTNQHGYASSTPVTDGERVYVFFGKTGVAAFTLAGEKLWHESVGTATDNWGTAASPIVTDGVVIVNAAIESESLVGLDAKSGKEKWRVKGIAKCWTTPLLVETKDGKNEVVMSLPGKVVAYEPKTGAELWRCNTAGAGGGGYTSSTPVARDGVVYVVTGGKKGESSSVAVKVGGRGDITDSHVLWKKGMGTGIASPVLAGDQLCWVAGLATVLKTNDGSIVTNERLYTGGQEYVSTVSAGGKIFALTRTSGLYVLAGDGKFQELAHNEFKGDDSLFNASPAVSDGKMYIRSNEYLYAIGKK